MPYWMRSLPQGQNPVTEGLKDCRRGFACVGLICQAHQTARLVRGLLTHACPCSAAAAQQCRMPCGHQGCVCRSHLASLLKEHCLVEGGDSNVKQWLKDVGVDGSVASALKVVAGGSVRWHAVQQQPVAEVHALMAVQSLLKALTFTISWYLQDTNAHQIGGNEW